jgi:hypothetical protein
VNAAALITDVVNDWTAYVYGDLDAVHHFDLDDGAATYRAFLLSDGLEIDIGFAPSTNFGPSGDGKFDVAFGEPVDRRPSKPNVDHLVGLSWHHLLHARTSLERGAAWQAEHWISALRDHTIALACIRCGLPWHYGKGADRLPEDERRLIERALPVRLDRDELFRALGAAGDAFLRELRHADPVLATKLRQTPLVASAD